MQQEALDTALDIFIKRTEIRNKKTAEEYRNRLKPFKDFVFKKYGLSLDELITTLTFYFLYSHGPKIDVYEMFSEYVSYILRERNVNPGSLRSMLNAVKIFLEYYDVEISERKFRLKVGSRECFVPFLYLT